MTTRHVPVMVAEVLEALAVKPGGIYVDATLGTGGHTEALLKAASPNGQVIGIDCDAAAVAIARERLQSYGPRFVALQGNFAQLSGLLQGIQRTAVDGILADLGVSSLQFDTAARGFSFARRGPLDMRMDSRQPTTAEALVNEGTEQELANWFHRYGEERFAKRVARVIVERRREGRLTDTATLAEVVRAAIPAKYRRGKIDAATRVFQALRIVVNGELINLERLLGAAPLFLKPEGRLVVISYHSLEDRLVKERFRNLATGGQAALVTKKPLTPTVTEVRKNPRARSAKLRAMIKTG